MNLQFKWDVWLITAWFNRPSYYMGSISDEFRHKHNLEFDSEEIRQLKRYPYNYADRKRRVQPWICNALKKLSNVLWNCEISDAFDIAEQLAKTNIDSPFIPVINYLVTEEEKADEIRTKNFLKRKKKADATHQQNWDAHKRSNQWGVTK